MAGLEGSSPDLHQESPILIAPSELHRTAKILADGSAVESLAEAQRSLEEFVLQVDVGSGLEDDATAQAALLTVVNTGTRAFLGGVRVRLTDDPRLKVGWGAGRVLSTALRQAGAKIVSRLGADRPTLVIAKASPSVGSPVLHITWQNWSGGVVQEESDRLDGRPSFELAGVVAGAIGVSECFQLLAGSVVAGRRDVGVSLWSPNAPWREAPGATVELLPNRVWLLGLGHLGQAHAWALGMLPFTDPRLVHVVLQDFDSFVPANLATGLLATSWDVGLRKTRVVSRRLEQLGFQTSLYERRFDEGLRRADDEPGLALAGFDQVEPRRALEEAKFQRIVDAGIGGGARDYLDLLIHTFPASVAASDSYPRRRREYAELSPVYETEVRRMVNEGGLDEGEARCAVVQVANSTAGAAFVGAVTAALVLADPIRSAHCGPEFEVVGLNLRDWALPDVAVDASGRSVTNTGFVRAGA